jgi:hypothetical protein
MFDYTATKGKQTQTKGWLIEGQRTSYHINWGTNTNSKEASTKTSKEVGDHIIFEPREFQNCLQRIQFV